MHLIDFECSKVRISAVKGKISCAYCSLSLLVPGRVFVRSVEESVLCVFTTQRIRADNGDASYRHLQLEI